jgi:hypothetical protein
MNRNTVTKTRNRLWLDGDREKDAGAQHSVVSGE